MTKFAAAIRNLINAYRPSKSLPAPISWDTPAPTIPAPILETYCNAGIIGNDATGWVPDCMCGAEFPGSPRPREEALKDAKFHYDMMTRDF